MTNGTVRPCAADVDGDGRLDLFFANYGPNGLFLNRGGGRFEDASTTWGVAIDARYDACAFADFDNDGDVDLFVNGTVTGGVSYRDYLFRSTGSRFEDVTPQVLQALEADHGVQWADFDRDGAVDLALTGARAQGTHALLRNGTTAAGRSLQIRVVDRSGGDVRAGAEVRVVSAANGTLIGTRITDTGSGYDSQSLAPVHFGLPDLDPVDITVTFPLGGRRVTARVTGVDPRTHARGVLVLHLHEDGSITRS
jgi:hypothetical protein